MTRDQIILLGEAAKRLLNDEAAMQAFAQIEADLTKEWSASRPNDTQGREDTYRVLFACQRLKAQLETMAANAVMETQKAQQAADQQAGRLSPHT